MTVEVEDLVQGNLGEVFICLFLGLAYNLLVRQ